MCIQPFQEVSSPLIGAAGTLQGSPTPLTPAAAGSPWKRHLHPLQENRDARTHPSGKQAPCPISFAANGSDLHQHGSPKDLSNRHGLCKKTGTTGSLVPSEEQQRPLQLSPIHHYPDGAPTF